MLRHIQARWGQHLQEKSCLMLQERRQWKVPLVQRVQRERDIVTELTAKALSEGFLCQKKIHMRVQVK